MSKKYGNHRVSEEYVRAAEPKDSACPAYCALLHLVYKGFAVGAFLLGGIHLMGADLDGVQGAVVGAARVMCTVVNRTLNGFIFAA